MFASDLPICSGVYRIENRRDGRLYIGSGLVNIRARCMEHDAKLRAGTHGNPLLQ
jgi:predicted GIY-YIG superfamily endonuclease